jgi:hypothetical protein
MEKIILLDIGSAMYVLVLDCCEKSELCASGTAKIRKKAKDSDVPETRLCCREKHKINHPLDVSQRQHLFITLYHTTLVMKSIPLVFLIAVFISGCSLDKCPDMHCGYNQQCNNNTCSCIDWYEGPNCQTEMRAKWIGTYIGTTHTNASLTGVADTFTFVKDATQIDYNYCSNKQFRLSIRNTREASIPGWSRGTIVWDPIHMDSVYDTYGSTGVAIVSEDGKNATLTYTTTHSYYNLHTWADSLATDSSVMYTFTGVKQ